MTSDAKHTPAPWEVCEQERGRVTGPVVGIGGCISTVATAGYGLRSNAEAEANARLISAAPDLLAALKELMAVQDCAADCWCVEVGNPGSCEACQARAAIAKAEARS